MPQAHDLSLGGTVVAGAADRGHHFSKPILDRLVLVEGHGVEGDAHAGAFVWHRYLARLSSRQFGILNGNRKFRAGRRKVHGRTSIGHDTLRSIEGIQGTSCEVDVLGRDVRHSHHGSSPSWPRSTSVAGPSGRRATGDRLRPAAHGAGMPA
jgi:hypothetical protein